MENNIVQLLFCIAPDAIQHELSASMDSTIEQVTLRLSKELNLNPKSVRYPDFGKKNECCQCVTISIRKDAGKRRVCKNDAGCDWY